MRKLFTTKSVSFIFSTVLLLSIGAFQFPIPSHAATEVVYDWTYQIGGTGSDVTYKVETDSSGNVIFVGAFSGSNIDFDGTSGTDTYSSNGSSDIYITKYSSDGSYLWTRTVGGTSADQAYEVAIDSNNDIFITGFFNSASVDFDGTAGTDTHTNASTAADIFVSKYNSDGSYGWTRTMGGTDTDIGTSLDIDGSGNVVYSGYFQSTSIDFDGTAGTDSHSLVGTSDLFVSSYTSTGNYNSTFTAGAASAQVGSESLIIDSNNYIYIAGYVLGSNVDFDQTAGTDLHSGDGTYTDVFIARYNTMTTYGWTESFGGNNWDRGVSIDLDSNEDIIVSGHYESTTIDLDSGAGTDSHTNNGGYDVFVVKYLADSSFSWGQAWGGTQNEVTNGIRLNSTDDYYVVGGFLSSNVDFDTTTGTDLHSTAGTTDIYVTKYLSNGDYGWTKTIGGTDVDTIADIAIYNDTTLYLAGYFDSSNVDFDPTSGTDSFSSAGGHDIFLAKWFDHELVSITNLDSSLNVTELNTSLDAEVESAELYGAMQSIRLLSSSDVPIADITTDLTQSRDWSTVSAGINTTNGGAFVSNLASAPGTDATLTLYIPRFGNEDSVIICPNATSLSEVTASCSGAYELPSSDSDVSEVTIGSQDLWAVANVSGTGGLEGTLSQSSSTTTTTSTGLGILPETGDLPDTSLSERAKLTITLGVVLMALGFNSLVLRERFFAYVEKLKKASTN